MGWVEKFGSVRIGFLMLLIYMIVVGLKNIFESCDQDFSRQENGGNLGRIWWTWRVGLVKDVAFSLVIAGVIQERFDWGSVAGRGAWPWSSRSMGNWRGRLWLGPGRREADGQAAGSGACLVVRAGAGIDG